jgi:hypothetical protein
MGLATPSRIRRLGPVVTGGPRLDLIGGNVTAVPVPADLRVQLLEAGEQVARLGSFEWLPGPDQLAWSDNRMSS